MAETEMILDVLLGDGDDSELEGLSDGDETAGNSCTQQNSTQNFLDICADIVVEEDITEIDRLVEVSNDPQVSFDPVLETNDPIQINDLGENNIQSENEIPTCSQSGRNQSNRPTHTVSKDRRASGSRRLKKRKAIADTKTSKRPRRQPLKWEKKKFSCQIPSIDLQQNDAAQVPSVLTPLQYFTSYYPDEFFKKTAEFTNMYSLSKFGKQLNTDSAEIKKLYGMHLMMGCLTYPRLRMYWSSGIELKPISQAMTRDRYFLLRNCLHVVDVNDPPPERDRLWKVQPVLDSVKSGCNKIERVPGNYSIDEQMIPFTGRTTLKQYVPNKPRPVGIKNFVLTTSNGILLDFEVYQGESTHLPMKQTMGLGPAVVMRLKECVPPLSVLYFDHFTSLQLMEQLSSEQYFGTGTLMLNRLQEITFCPNSDLRRGDFEEICSSDGRFAAIKWMDNQSVVMLSSVCGSEPVTFVKRWSKKEGVFINVQCPAAIVTYNKNMGGVDLFNQQMEVYRTWFKTKKWTLKVILHFLDLAVVNGWFQYTNDCKLMKKKKKETMDLLEFRMSLSETLMCRPPTANPDYHEHYEEEADVRRKPQNWRAPIPATDKRTDRFDHFPVVDDLKTARKCRLKDCASRTRIRCEKCNVYLCLSKTNNCFKNFHVQK